MSFVTPDGRYELIEDEGASDHWGGVPEPTIWLVVDLKKNRRELFRLTAKSGYDDVYLSEEGWEVIAEDADGKIKDRIDIREVAARINSKKKK